MQTAFTENFEGTYKRPHNIGDLQRCRQADDETSRTFLAQWLDMKNSCEGVTDESAILAFIDSLERGQLLRHRLLRERNEGKLTLNSMITIAGNYAAADDDARESLKASAIQNTGKRNNSNKRKNPPEEQQTPDMVATTFADKGQSSQRGKGRGTSNGQPRSSTAPASAPSAPCPTMSIVICHASPIETLQGSAITPTGTKNLSMISRRIKKLATSTTGDNGLVAKEKQTRIRSPRRAVIWTKTLRPNPPKRQRVGLARVTHSKIPTKREPFHTFLGPPTAKAQRAAMRSLNATVPKVRQYV
jgi:hypothetical protein